MEKSEVPFGGRMRNSAPEDSAVYFARGVIIILMVYGHVDHVGLYEALQEHIYKFMHMFRMPVLILISGYFFRDGRAMHKYGLALRKIAVPYVIFEVLYLASHYFMSVSGAVRVNRHSVMGWEDAAYAFVFKPHGPFWFLRDFALVYLAYLATLSATRVSSRLNIGVFFTFVLWAMGGLGLIHADFAVFFPLGYWAGKFFNRFPRSGAASFVLIASLALAATTGAFENYALKVLMASSAAAALVWLGDLLRPTLARSAIEYCGKASMHILCWHAFFIAALRIAAAAFIAMDSSGLSYSIASTMLGVVSALVMKRLLEIAGLDAHLFGSKPQPAAIKVATPSRA